MEYTLSTRDIEAFDKVIETFGQVDFKDNGLPSMGVLQKLDELKQKGSFSKLLTVLGEALSCDSDAGYVLVRGIPVDDLYKETPQYLTLLSSLVGLPFQMGTRFPAWQNLGVNFSTADHKFGGTGYQPSHIDGVNVEMPPDFLVLSCVRPDPLGGGKSTLSYLQDIPKNLSSEDKRLLSQEIFSEGEFYDLAHVGQEKKPFRVIEETEFGLLRVRFSGKILYELSGTYEHHSLFSRALKELDSRMIEIMMQPGEALIVNQLLLAHGRTPLGEHQFAVPDY